MWVGCDHVKDQMYLRGTVDWRGSGQEGRRGGELYLTPLPGEWTVEQRWGLRTLFLELSGR